jgi:hypothetical protein
MQVAMGKIYNTALTEEMYLTCLQEKNGLLNNRNILGLSAKVTFMGGLRYTPALYEESIAEKRYIPDQFTIICLTVPFINRS